MADENRSHDDHITLWIEHLRDHQDQAAAQKLWNRYSTRLAALARQRFGQLSRRTYDEEDAAISAFRSFCNGVAQERFLDLNDRDNLWRILVTITSRKVMARHRYEGRVRRGGADQWEQSMSAGGEGGNAFPEPECPEPSPEFVAEVADECDALIARLEDEELQTVVLLKLEGYTNDEIATKLGYGRRSIQRKLTRIRRKLDDQADDVSASEDEPES